MSLFRVTGSIHYVILNQNADNHTGGNTEGSATNGRAQIFVEYEPAAAFTPDGFIGQWLGIDDNEGNERGHDNLFQSMQLRHERRKFTGIAQQYHHDRSDQGAEKEATHESVR